MQLRSALWIPILAGTAWAQSGPLYPGAIYGVGGAPQALALGDLNGDGKLDLVTGNSGSTISTALGQAGGTFAAAATFATGGAATSIALGDLNGNGQLDAVVGVGAAGVSILFGNGAGGFGAATTVGVGADVASVSLGDVNNDGKLDLATAPSGFGNTVLVMLGNGVGGFGAPASFAVGIAALSVSIADVSGDGKRDLVVGRAASTVAVLLGDGLGGFGAATSFPSAVGATFLEVADLSADGALDVAIAPSGFTGNVAVLLGNGAGSLGAATTFSDGGLLAVGIASGDLNADGKRDVAVGLSSPRGVSVLAGNGAGALGAPLVLSAGNGPTGIAVGDLNADGKADVAVCLAIAQSVSVLLQRAAGAFDVPADFAAGTSPAAVAAADLGSDGRRDLVVANTASNDLTIRLGDGAGGFGAPSTVAVGAAPRGVALGDFNADGKRDAATANSGANALSVLLGDGAGGLALSSSPAVGTTPVAVAAADLNADGKLDLVAVNSASNNVSVLLGDGLGGFGAAASFATGASPRAVGVGDVTGDGKPDLVVANSGSNNVSLQIGTGLGGFSAPISFLAGTAPDGVAVGDLNGDARADVVTANSGSGNLSVLLATIGGSLGAATSFASGAFPSGVAIADVDGDAKQDVVATNRDSATVSLHIGNGAGSLAAAKSFAVSAGPDAVALADLNGDGRADAATADASGNRASVLVFLNAVPVIATQPTSQTLCGPSLVTFTVLASNATSFQWRKNTVPIVNGGAVSGATTATLTLNPAVPGDAGNYDVVVSNPIGSATSAIATLSVGAGGPTFTQQPASQSACAGGSVSFTVVAPGATSFQWRKNGVNVGGATSATLTLNPVAAGDAGSYDCVATNACGSSTSNAAALAVSTGNPAITLQPASQAACAGGSASFTVAATGATSFQWRKNGVNVGGATNATFTLNPVVAGDAASYDCIVSNACGSTTSSAATLAVSTGNPAITLQPVSQSACAGASASFTIAATGATSFQWRKNGVAIGGATSSSFTIASVVVGDAASYDCLATNACGSTASGAASLAVSTSTPSITLQPIGQSVCAGGAASFMIVASGATSFQWRKNGVNVGGATASTLLLSPVVAGDAGSYDCVASNACGPTTSAAAPLAVSTGNPSITLQPVGQAACAGASASFVVAATGATAFQWRKNGVNIGGATAASLLLNPVVAGDAGSYDCVASNPCGSTTSLAAALVVSTGNPTITAQPVNAISCAGASASFAIAATGATSFQWRKNGVNIGGATASSLVINPVAAGDAGTYDCVATNACGSTTSAPATLTVSGSVPSITLQPVGQAACIGGSATFAIAASGASAFQWRKNGVNIAGATLSSLLLTPIVAGDAASYDCVATNACGPTTSASALLLVSTGNPSITLQPVNQSKCVGGSATFTIAATDATSFQWRKNGADIAGATASALLLSPIVAGDAASYDCVATNACGSATSAAATLAVSTGNPTFTQQPASVTTCAGSSASFTIAATGAISFQWRKNAVDIPGATATTFTIASIVAGDAASYDCVATNPCASTTSSGATLAIQTIVFVNKAATGANTGKSWTDAFTDLQSALTSPCVNVEVWVAAATYFPDGGSGNRAATFPLSSGMKVYGGFMGTETLLSQRDPIAHTTTLSGDIGLTGNVADNSFHVVTGSGASATALLDGFTIAAGKSDGGNGGGLEIVGGSPRIERCIFNGNSATNGGGLHVSGGAPTLVRCVFQSNAATGSGGAVWDGGSVSLASCAFRANTAASAGGAIFRDVAAGTTSVVNAAMTGNSAPSGGAILSNGSLSLSSCSLALNMATGAGGGVRTTGALTATNSILYFNGDAAGQVESSQVSVGGGTASVNFCDVQGLTGGLGGSGNLGGDPKFADANGLDDLAGTADDDLRLRPGSPCIDAGSNALLALDAADLDGDANLAEALPLDLHEHLRQIEDPFTANTGAGAAPFADLGALEECHCEGVPYGTGTPGCNGTQQMGTSSPANVGNLAFAFTCTKAPASALGLGIVADVADFNGTDLFAIGILLHVDLVFSTLVQALNFNSDATGFGTVPSPIPNNPSFIGASLYAQGVWSWGAACTLPPFGLSSSEGIRITFVP